MLSLHDLVVVDCRAAASTTSHEIDAFDVFRQVQAKLTLIMPVNHEADSVEQIRAFTDDDTCLW